MKESRAGNDWQTECAMSEQVGWRVKGKWIKYESLDFSLSAPKGHLPAVNGWIDGKGWHEKYALLSRNDLDNITVDLSDKSINKMNKVHDEAINDNEESKNIVDADDLFSARSVDYRSLRDALQSSQWREADRQTAIALLQFFGKDEHDNLTTDDIDQLHEIDIRTIDNLWLKYSNSQFGFSIQKRIYVDAGGKPDCEYYWDAWNKFGVYVGWRERGKWKSLSEIVYDISSPKGHLPVLESWWMGSNEKIGIGSDEGTLGRRLWRFLLSHKGLEVALSDIEKKVPEISASQTSSLHDASHRLHVFLCHSSGDKESVRKLYKKLKSDGVYPWLDEENLLPGQDWQEEIAKAVHETDVVIVCLSNESINKKGFVQKEIKFALDIANEQPEGTIFIIPLRLEECIVPQRLSRLHWINFFEESGYQRLILALRSRATSLGITLQAISALQQVLDQGDSSAIVSLETCEQDLKLRITVPEGFNVSSSNKFLAFSEWKPIATREGNRSNSFAYPIEGQVLPSNIGKIVEIFVCTNNHWWNQGKHSIRIDGTFSGTVFLNANLPSAIFRFDILNENANLIRRFDVPVV